MQLKDWLEKRGISVVRFAADTGLSRAYASRMMSGERKASPEIIMIAHRYTAGEVGVEEWVKLNPAHYGDLPPWGAGKGSDERTDNGKGKRARRDEGRRAS